MRHDTGESAPPPPHPHPSLVPIVLSWGSMLYKYCIKNISHPGTVRCTVQYGIVHCAVPLKQYHAVIVRIPVTVRNTAGLLKCGICQSPDVIYFL
jgi:hypothetical protein